MGFTASWTPLKQMQKREVKLCSLRRFRHPTAGWRETPPHLPPLRRHYQTIPRAWCLIQIGWRSQLILLECRVIVPGLITTPGHVDLNILSACLRNPSSVLQSPVCEHHPKGDTRLASSLRVTPQGSAGEGWAHRGFAFSQILGTLALSDFNLRHFTAWVPGTQYLYVPW